MKTTFKALGAKKVHTEMLRAGGALTQGPGLIWRQSQPATCTPSMMSTRLLDASALWSPLVYPRVHSTALPPVTGASSAKQVLFVKGLMASSISRIQFPGVARRVSAS